jgi:Zn-dependent protease
MPQEYRLFRITDIEIRLRPSAFFSALLIWAGVTAFTLLGEQLPAVQALLSGFIVALGHWFSAIWHHLGHAFVTKRLDYPMQAITLHGLTASAVYPTSEQETPADVHLRRALGGPAASAILTLTLYRLALSEYPNGGLILVVMAAMMVDNLLFFTLGAMLPLDFTDAGTLIRWWPRRPNSPD